MHRILALSLILTLGVISCNSSPQGYVLNPNAFKAMINDKPDEILLDVRTPEEYKEGFIKGAVNVDWNSSSFADEVAKLDKNKPVMVYCHSGRRSNSAAQSLRSSGFKEVYELEGGVMQWNNAGLPLVTEDVSPNSPAREGMTMNDYNGLLNTEKLVLIDFNAAWCGPCKKMAPFLKEIAAEKADVLDMHQIDSDKNNELAQKINITGLPTILLYKNKKLIWSNIGYIGKNELLEKISNFE